MSLNGFYEGAFPEGAWGASGFSGAGMNLNHWADGVWADGSHSAEAWGDAETPQPAETESPSGGWLRKNHPFLRMPRRTEEEDAAQAAPEAQLDPRPTAVILAADPSVAAIEPIERVAREAFFKEHARLMALEAARKAKRRRSAETLLLLM